MKKFLCLFFTIFFLGGTIACAQEVKKELKEENDGFKWYELRQDKYFGASNLSGNVIIPLSKKYTGLFYSKLESQDRGFFYAKIEGKEALYDKNGREVIPADRGYESIVYQISGEGYKYFQVFKDGMNKTGVCDLTGKELIAPQTCYIIYSDDNFKIALEDGSFKNTGIRLSIKDPLDSNSSFKQRVTEYKSDFKWYRVHKDDFIGAESIDGKTLVPAKYESVEYKFDDYHSNGLPYFEVKLKGAVGIYNLAGNQLISTDRRYDYIHYESSLEHPYFLVEKNGKKGACDLSGKEVLSPIYYHVFLSNYGFSTRLSENAEEEDTGIKINSKGLLVDNANPTEAEHQYRLGVDYFGESNHKEAVKWFRKSADQGYADAEFFLGLCYEFGHGLTINKQEALVWYRKAEAHGHSGASNKIAELTRPVTVATAQTNTTSQSTTPRNTTPQNTAPRNEVAYLDILRQYEGRSKIPDLGPYVKSEREEHSNGIVVYRFYNKDGGQKYVSIGKCYGPGCNNGVCTSFHLGGFCPNCGNSGKHIACGGTGTKIIIGGQLSWGYYTDDGIFHATNSGGGSNVSVPNSGGGYSGGSSNSSSSSSVYTKCNSCNGTGVCQRCHGKCGEWTDIGTYTGTNTKQWQNCVSCNGSGKCNICYGRGKL